VFYSVVMRREEQELRLQHGAAFDEYARAVPLFLPKLTPARLAPTVAGSFSFAQYKKNREYRAFVGFLLLLVLLLVIWRWRQP
jgi:protein-S-isoprenylcysteine O-methyltransferase Ste14